MADRQWGAFGVQIYEEGEEEYGVLGVQICEDQAGAPGVTPRNEMIIGGGIIA